MANAVVLRKSPAAGADSKAEPVIERVYVGAFCEELAREFIAASRESSELEYRVVEPYEFDVQSAARANAPVLACC